ncbi:hypothetical protein L3Q82_005660 [Scortum barcoo]|uniref:Uncharacterized protein n=1 Tax=Scortum barcoo TaxID=214431 RepID=A0ACB8V631_9TELE|nr:hypothetical protein L3Q82_005660 [Scortum barcoo]
MLILFLLLMLRLGRPEPYVTAVPPSDPVCPGDSVTLQCSVLSDNRTHPEDHHVYWFAGSSVEAHEKDPEGLSVKKCICSFFLNVSSSDAGTYYCVVATSEDMLEFQRDNMILLSLCAALTISLIVIASLICSKKSCDCCDGTVPTGGQKNQHLRNLRRDEDMWVYSAAVFTMMKVGSGGTRDSKAAKRERT